MKKAMRFVAVAVSAVLAVPVIAMSAATVSVDAGTMPRVAVSQEESLGASDTSGRVDTTGKINTQDFDIQVEVGLEGNYRPYSAIPVSIDIESLRDDFEGTVRIIVPAADYSDDDGTAYEKSVMLTQASPKVVTLSVYNDDMVNYIYFQLLDEKGRIVIDKKIRLNQKSSDNALIGILSDDYTALNYFDQKNIDLNSYSGVTQLLELNADKMPEQASGLGVLSYLIINSYDTQKLSGEQVDAIEGYVRDGGILIVGAGADYQQTVSNFEDSFVPLVVDGYAQGMLEVSDNGYVEWYDYGEEDEEITDAEEDGPQAEDITDAEEDIPQDGLWDGISGSLGNPVAFDEKDGILNMSLTGGKALDEVLTQEGLVWLYRYGQGNVVVTAFNLGMEPVNSWADKNNMAVSLLAQAANGYSGERLTAVNYGGSSVSLWSVENLLESVFEDKKPIFPLMVACLSLFIVSCPVSFAILKSMKKPMWIWVVIPANAVLATATILLSTLNLRIHAPEVATFTLMRQEDSTGEMVGVENYMGILIPSTRMTEIEFDKDITSLRILQYSRYSYNSEEADDENFTKIFRENADGYQLAFENKNTFETGYVTFNSTPDAGNQGLDTEFIYTMTGLRGTIVNRSGYDLSHVLVYGEDICVEVNDLPDGASFTFDENDNLNASGYYFTVPGIDSWDKDYDMLDGMYEYVYNEYMSGGSQEVNTFYVVGYVEDYKADYVTTQKTKERNEALFLKSLTAPLTEYEGAKMAPLSDYASYNEDWDPYDGMLYEREVYADFELFGYFSSVQALIARPSEYDNGYGGETKVYAYNYATGKYDRLFEDSTFIEFDGKCPYLSDNMDMHLKFSCTSTYDSYVPEIIVVGEE